MERAYLLIGLLDGPKTPAGMWNFIRQHFGGKFLDSREKFLREVAYLEKCGRIILIGNEYELTPAGMAYIQKKLLEQLAERKEG
ncbi:hypothetical protein KKC88_01850 [Patescibacteria group bacterium]|nr:hypothetical protein [Patescibacteria group bacterium]MBU1673865.1 hypothetical protein [Patescibacteria group bacterium]MBU1963242.1 hypothetical protein [Patescibacteria group bacterium]